MTQLKEQKTKYYNQYKKLIYKMAFILSKRTGLEMEDLVSEFNLVFCEAYEKYDPDSVVQFSVFLNRCCMNRLANLFKAMGAKKRKMEVLTDADFQMKTHDPIDSIIIYDNFVNSNNLVIQKIARIVSIYTLPRTHFRKWLTGILKDSFTRLEIIEAFRILRTLNDTK